MALICFLQNLAKKLFNRFAYIKFDCKWGHWGGGATVNILNCTLNSFP